ncbi:Hypothetical predicted protein [Olea europaea subsp. europaea]|uniref:Uncharacterized protein n=1 Tax=Olea europaea subsp. europaea TaxID=158383 RepID=A0A8S0RRC6_OLEEU|nr:Hypothetical predicted protein [Olea europaea subsp. europaea]
MDQASDRGVRGADDDRRRGASGELLEGRDSGKNLLQRREGERSQPWSDRASDCGVRGASGDRKRGINGERLEGRDRGKNCFSGEKVIAVRAYLMSVQCRERSQPRRDRASDCGVRGAGGDRKRGASGERSEGRDRGKKLLQLREGVLMGSDALALVWSHQSVIAVRAYFMSVQRRERSQPRRDRASDCGVREVLGDRKRGAGGERLEGGIGKKIASAARRSSAGSDSNCGGIGPAIVGSAEPAAIESEGPAGSAWRDGIGEKNCFKGEKVSNCGPSVFDVSPAQGAIATAEGPGQRLWGPRSPRLSKVGGQRGALRGAG